MCLRATSLSQTDIAALSTVEDALASPAKLPHAFSAATSPPTFPYGALPVILSIAAAIATAFRAFSFAIQTHTPNYYLACLTKYVFQSQLIEPFSLSMNDNASRYISSRLLTNSAAAESVKYTVFSIFFQFSPRGLKSCKTKSL